MADSTEEISLLDSLEGEWIKLLVPAMRDVGAAAQTLGGLLKVTLKETYAPVEDIASKARLPVATVRKHLVVLDKAGWIRNAGRGHTRRGSPRRTCTIKITDKTRKALDTGISLDGKQELTYALLPWWACCSGNIKMPWCARAVLSVVMARLASLKAAVDRQDGKGLSADDMEASIESMGGDDRFQFSLRRLTEQTGLTHDSVTTAKRILNCQFGIVEWEGTLDGRRRAKKGTIIERDRLAPNWDFRVLVTPASEGHCHVAFRG